MTSIKKHNADTVAAVARDLAAAVLESSSLDSAYLEELGLDLSRDQKWEILILNLFFATAATLKACAAQQVAADRLTDAFYTEVFSRAFEDPADRNPFTDRFLGRWKDYRDFLLRGSRERILERIRVLEENLGTSRTDALLYMTAALSHRAARTRQSLSCLLAEMGTVAA